MNRGEKIFTLKLTIGQTTDCVEVFEADEPSAIASAFLSQHGLPEVYKPELEKLIEARIDRFIESIKESNGNRNQLNPANDTKGTLRVSDLDTELDRSKEISKFNWCSPEKWKLNVNKIKLHRFMKVFNLLRPNTQGKINAKMLKRANLEYRMYKILKPVLEDIERKGRSVDYKEFCVMMEVLIRYLNDDDKYFLLTPNICARSPEMPNRHRKSSPFSIESPSKSRLSLKPFR